MLNIKMGRVIEILEERNNSMEIYVDINGKQEKAIVYKNLVSKIHKGNEVLLNTTAKDMKLGTGGYHFVLANMDTGFKKSTVKGHIMKLRYTPLQMKVNSCEEQNSQYHNAFKNFTNLNRMPVLIGGLHSMLSPLSIVLKSFYKDIKISYIMTDGGALPLDFSKSTFELKEKGYINNTITVGHAFGGEYECVNIYNGLIMSKEVLKSDIAIVLMGPGIVGTGTKYGFSGIEQGNIIDAVNDLEGVPICIPRISFSDKRNRHYGISHHTLTVLNKICKTKAIIGIPLFEEKKLYYIKKQIEEYNLDSKHDIIYDEYNNIIDILRKSDICINTMGRNIDQDMEYFTTTGVNAKLALRYISALSYS